MKYERNSSQFSLVIPPLDALYSFLSIPYRPSMTLISAPVNGFLSLCLILIKINVPDLTYYFNLYIPLAFLEPQLRVMPILLDQKMLSFRDICFLNIVVYFLSRS